MVLVSAQADVGMSTAAAKSDVINLFMIVILLIVLYVRCIIVFKSCIVHEKRGADFRKYTIILSKFVINERETGNFFNSARL